ncbi:uncharacterized protein PFL1_05370 [Pseudozyma flocculosa PF-1]|uniref:Uncharacterized protein n=2 Tax=Pseudozyma flocculosa TaxID=84751 RepID=A0A5C3FB40_9BASI|nr:uncharacterized protein PFL1_05370 [Pseudozyma flocculosa PF-1]EPQ27086.1 hypothetical protein PFL1_05370 [Pseudozyma flocculosa PF-1]SPO41346.1 uncharacterized protein PSFLO_06828 [Pseudozyma flocculosa]
MATQTTPTTTTTQPGLTEEQVDDLLFAARVGDLEDVAAFLDPTIASATASGDEAQIAQLLLSIKNDSDNTLLHYCSANGHLDLVNYLLPHSNLSYLLHQNASGNTALHWAGLNGHLPVVTALIDRIEACERAHPDEASKLNLLLHIQPSGDEKHEEGSERKLWDVRNAAGRGPMSEAQMNEREDVVKYLLERMIEGGAAPDAPASTADAEQQAQDGIEEKTAKLRVGDEA